MDDDQHLALAILSLVEAMEAGDEAFSMEPKVAKKAWDKRERAYAEARTHALAIINRYGDKKKETEDG